ncbi:3'-5' exonuclease [Anopheles ziemanni]|uniref:3'-5' exonuclease n=1 Tax=Anopheles coustani TaxID=139045 RepID=UPI002658C029|nr:3'-5' exonuclease [Anopheles coustani]XP_058176667.1 3'-5' exonuclease [Anopheles ziemanni]
MSKRTLPLWMMAQRKPIPKPESRTDENHSENKPPFSETSPSLETNSNDGPKDEPPKRRLRSNYTFPSAEKQPDMKIEYLPFAEYHGVIEYYTTMHDIAFCCHQLLQWVHSQLSDSAASIPIAFDLEWRFSFRTGPGKTALMQLCATTDRCVLLQLSCLKRLPLALLELLYHPRVVLHGVCIKNDMRKLARDFPEVDGDRLISKCCDLGQWYNTLHDSTGRWSMERLVQAVLRQRINKNNAVRMSRWDVLPLSEDQKLYAAMDVYITQQLYLKLTEKQQQQLAEQEVDAQLEQQLIVTPSVSIDVLPAKCLPPNSAQQDTNHKLPADKSAHEYEETAKRQH